MKKLTLILLLLVTNHLFAFDFSKKQEMKEKLTLELCELILRHEKMMKEKGVNLVEAYWTSICIARNKSYHTFPFKMKKGYKYVFYTRTTGPKVSICVQRDREPKIKICGEKASNSIIFQWECIETGQYHYIVRGETTEMGLHRSFVSYITPNNETEEDLNYDVYK